MNTDQIRDHLQMMRAARDEAIRRRDSIAFQSADAQVLKAERALASLQKEEYAEPMGDAAWRPEHPSPLIWSDGSTVWLICPVPSSERPLTCRVVKFSHVLGCRFASTSDHLQEQPLSGRGLEACAALEVRNSVWIRSFQTSFDGEKYWSEVRHFALCFKDCLVEVVAKSAEWICNERSLSDWLVTATSASVNSITFARPKETNDRDRP